MGKGIKENINNSCEDESCADGREISSSKGGTYFSCTNTLVFFVGGDYTSDTSFSDNLFITTFVTQSLTSGRASDPNKIVRFMDYLTSDKKQEIFGQYGKSNKDTGSPESQVALFSFRINHLTEHLKTHPKDFSTQRALLKLVGRRRKLLAYLKEIDIERYRAIIKALNLRR